MMTADQIADHNETCAALTAEDGIPRLTWEQHAAAFAAPASELAPGQQVAAWDSATPGVIGGLSNGTYEVTFSDLGEMPLLYPASQLRPWPLDGKVA